MFRIILFLSFTIGTSSLLAQITFTEQNHFLNNSQTFSGAPIGVNDVDNDGLDDIVVLSRTNDLIVYYQKLASNFGKVDYGNLGGYAWGMTIGNLDNLGMSEIMAGGAYDDLKLIKLLDQGNASTGILNGPEIFVQAVSFADINNDGNLDAFACDDNGPSSVYINDGLGNLNYNNQIFNTTLFDGEELDSGNYGNVWSDFDSDGDLDLYISKCRQNVNDPKDVRRINQLWLNDGNSNYSEAANDYGLAIGWQSWTTEFQDIDNDNDFDALITNHDHETMLLENINNSNFVDITLSSGIQISGLPIQACMKDFDNDGFVDVLVSGSTDEFWMNNGDKTFTKKNVGFVEGLNSFAIGDLNNDGFLDVFAGFGEGFNGPSEDKPDLLYINEGNDNNHFTVDLEGKESNADGIGARLELYGEWGVMLREVRAGESYGITHTRSQNFGLGEANEIDSLVIYWPSGLRESYNELAVNQKIKVIENTCISPASNVSASGPLIFCQGESISLTAPDGYQYLWSTGDTTQSILVGEGGDYFVNVFDGGNCTSQSQVTTVVVDPVETLEIINESDLTFCEGDACILKTSDGSVVEWSNGQAGTQIEVFTSGVYYAITNGLCDDVLSNEIITEMIDAPATPMSQEHTISPATSILLNVEGENVEWYDDLDAENLIALGNEYQTEILNESKSFYVLDNGITVGLSQSIGETSHTGLSDYNANNFNASMLFTVLEETTLESVDVETETFGLRKIQLKNELEEVLEELIVDVQEELTTIELNWKLSPDVGEYSIGTELETNQQSFATNSPQFKRTSSEFEGSISYPYVIEDTISITGSNFGPEFYYYFYNWKVEGIEYGCKSKRSEIRVNVEFTIADQNIESADKLSVFPNPTSQSIEIKISDGLAYELELKSLNGQLLRSYKEVVDGSVLDLSGFSSGIYLVYLQNDKGRFVGKIVKQEQR